MLSKIIGNVVKYPGNPKFRNLNYDKVIGQLWDCPKARDFLFAVAFSPPPPSHGEGAILGNAKTKKQKRIK